MSVASLITRRDNNHGRQQLYTPPNVYYVDQDSPFSAGSKYPIVIRGKDWPTSEHYFQAQKFHNTSYEEQIRTASTVGRAKKLGNDRKIAPIKNWAVLMEPVMKEALFTKILQHPELKQALLQTGTSTIIKKTNSDYFWGSGATGSGENKFGQILMQIRDSIRTAETEGRTAEVQFIEWDPSTGWEETKKHRASTRDKKLKKRVKVKARRSNEKQVNEQVEQDEEEDEEQRKGGFEIGYEDDGSNFEGNELMLMDIEDAIKEVEQNIEILLVLPERESRVLLGEQKDKVGALILRDELWSEEQRGKYFALVDRLDKLL